ncbi:MAG: phosphoenolpyruvate--protein phosphotransferase [Acidobacteriota bacterium]
MTKDSPAQLSGIGLSPGLAIGTAYEIEPPATVFYRTRIASREVSHQLKRFRSSIERSRRQLLRVKKKFERELGKEHSYIIDSHLLILEDRQLLEDVEKRIQEDRHSPERAVRESAETWLSVYRSLDDPYFRERGSDVEEVVERVIGNLVKLSPQSHEGLPEELILVVPEVSLSLLAQYPIDQVKGLIVRRGGPTSHGIIIAHSYHIPVVSGLKNPRELIHTGDTVIVDGSEGTVQVDPERSEIRLCRTRIRREERRRLALAGDPEPCTTIDDLRISVYANSEIDGEVPAGFRLGGEGIGLFRSEFVYMQEKNGPISEEKQFRIYKRLARAVKDRPGVIRTLDLGNERHPYFSQLTGGESSALGVRGIRMSLKHPKIFKAQIRAILRASAFGNLKIVFPMVSSVEEVIEARRIVKTAQRELLRQGTAINESIEVGVMVEVPSAVILLEALCAHSDFFAVGTNDLIQYTMAAGRSEETLTHLFTPLHPAILKSLHRVAQVAAQQDMMALVCGEVASHPVYAALLVGMGFRHLSMNAYAIPEIKQRLRQISCQRSQEMLMEVLKLSSVKDIEAYVGQAVL